MGQWYQWVGPNTQIEVRTDHYDYEVVGIEYDSTADKLVLKIRTKAKVTPGV